MVCPISPRVKLAAESAFWVSVGTGVTVVAGFGLHVLMAALFGAGSALDAYLAAATLPLFLARLLSGGLPVSLVPALVAQQEAGRPDKAWGLVRAFSVWGGLVLSLAALAGMATAEPLLRLLAPGLARNAGLELASPLFAALVAGLPLLAIASVLRAAHEASRSFVASAWAPAAGGVVAIAVTLASAPWLGVAGVALGTLAGTLTQVVALAPLAVRHPGTLATLAEVRRALRPLLPWVAGASLYRANTLVDVYLASRLGPGAITALGLAHRVIGGVGQILSQGIATVQFRALSQAFARRSTASMRAALAAGVGPLVVVTLPAATALVCLTHPITAALFERGAFVEADTTRTASALLGYVGALLATAIGSVVTQLFYARGETGTVSIVGAVGMLANVGLAIALTPMLGVAGPALAYSAAAAFNLGVFLWIGSRRLGGLGLRRYTRLARRVLVALVPSSALWLALREPLASLEGPGSIVMLAAALAVGGLVYVALYRWQAGGDDGGSPAGGDPGPA